MRAKHTKLAHWVHANKPQMVLLQETHLKKKQEYKPPSGYVIAARKDGTLYDSKGRGGVLTFVREDVGYSKIETGTSKWTDAVTITLRGKKETTINKRTYLPWTLELSSLPTGRSCIIAGDLNAHGDWDQFQDADERGNKIEDSIMEKTFKRPTTPGDTRDPTQRQVDFWALTSPSLLKTSWRTSERSGPPPMNLGWTTSRSPLPLTAKRWPGNGNHWNGAIKKLTGAGSRERWRRWGTPPAGPWNSTTTRWPTSSLKLPRSKRRQQQTPEAVLDERLWRSKPEMQQG